jgi:rod shape-determining protein MreD
MAMMATTRREMEGPSYPWFIVLLLPLLAVGLQAYLPLRFPRLDIFNLPLLVVIYFAIARRSPIAGTLTGMVVGLMQDALTQRPLGINGISETVVGFLAASLGLRIDIENHGARLMLNFLFTLLYGFLYLMILRHLVGVELNWSWWHELLKAAVNMVVGFVLFAVLDRTQQTE